MDHLDGNESRNRWEGTKAACAIGTQQHRPEGLHLTMTGTMIRERAACTFAAFAYADYELFHNKQRCSDVHT